MYLHTRWQTRAGFKPAVFIYLATTGRHWRVHATMNNGEGGLVLLRQYYGDGTLAQADVEAIVSRFGGPDDWICEPIQHAHDR